MKSEAAGKADFSLVRYAQCWEDADILLAGLEVRPGDSCVSIASAGDNSISLLSRSPDRVVAIDLSPEQIACLELRVAAYRELEHGELLKLIGSRPSAGRDDLYRRCRPLLSSSARSFWDGHPSEIAAGIGGAGKFEHYLSLFRTRILPLVHSRRTIAGLLRKKTRGEREAFYDQEWDNRRWRFLFRLFFSRFVMGRMGRDPSFFQYVEGSVADRILARTRYALTALDPSENPYIQWILNGSHPSVLPHALRLENFELIRSNLDRLEWHCCPLEEFLEREGENSVDRFNLSDIFEYMSQETYHQLLELMAATGRSGGRIAYWNMLAPRQRPEAMADRLRPLDSLSRRLFGEDKAFFYSAFVVEEIV